MYQESVNPVKTFQGDTSVSTEIRTTTLQWFLQQKGLNYSNLRSTVQSAGCISTSIMSLKVVLQPRLFLRLVKENA